MVKLYFSDTVPQGLALAARVRKIVLCEDGIPVKVRKIEQGLSVSGAEGVYTIGYSEKATFFRAFALLVGHLEQGQKSFLIDETPAFTLCSAMVDCSRNAVPRVERLEELFATMAMMGYNSVMLYTEDTYEVEGYPWFGYRRGRYSKEELKHLDQVAQSLGLDMIPCIQTLAHLKTALRWAWTDGMRDNPDILLIGEQRTYQFIEAMFKSLRDSCSSKYIHIGMDEAHEVGRGVYMDKNGYADRFGIMCDHLHRVCALAEKYGFEPMMWSDMFFRMGSKKKIYYDPYAEIPANIAQMLPENLTMVYWDYFGVTDDRYRDMILAHDQLGCPLIFAGGIWKWRGMAPNNALTFETTRHALNVCKNRGVRQVVATMWGDDGAEVSQYAILLGMQFFAEFNYKESPSLEEVLNQFNLCTGLSGKDQLKLSIDDFDTSSEPKMRYALSKQILYSDITQGLMDKHLQELGLEGWFEKKQQALASVGTDLPQLYEYYKLLVDILKDKWNLGIRLRSAYKAGDRVVLAACAQLCGQLAPRYRALRDAAYKLWMWENKAQGFELFDLRLSGMAGRCESTQKRVCQYLSGEIAQLEELTEETLYFDESRIGSMPHPCFFRKVFSTATEFGVYI